MLSEPRSLDEALPDSSTPHFDSGPKRLPKVAVALGADFSVMAL